MHYTRRWADESRNLGWWDALPVIEQRIESLKLRLQNPAAQAPVAQGERTEAQRITNLIARLSGIECSVHALLHAFAEDTLQKCEAPVQLQHDRFEPHRERVHAWLIDRADAWAPLAQRYDRSVTGDAEAARSLAMGCMALLAAAADKLVPEEDAAPGSGPYGKRLLAFIMSGACAPERKRRLRHTLMDVTDRLSLAEHGDVSVDEAGYLYLTVYLFLSELSRFRPESGKYWLTASS
jgi:hypothetical protein